MRISKFNLVAAGWASIRLLNPRLQAMVMETMRAWQLDAMASVLLADRALFHTLYFLQLLVSLFADRSASVGRRGQVRQHSNNCKLTWVVQ